MERKGLRKLKFFNESEIIKAGFKPQTRILSDESGTLITEKKHIVKYFKD